MSPTNPKGYMLKYYKANKEKWNNKKETHKRVVRNAARRKMEKKYGKMALKGKDVDHKNGTGAGNSWSNLRIRSRKLNRNKYS